MPTPVAALLNNPEMTFNRGRRDDNGSRLLLNCMAEPEPFAHQCLGLTPLPMNRAANRWGGDATGVPEGESLPRASIDSSHGRPTVTPTPVRNVRRLIMFGRDFPMLIPKSVSVDYERETRLYSTVHKD